MDDPREELYGVSHLAMPHSVIPPPTLRKDSFVLCGFTGKEAVNGFCEEHQSDACLSLYVRYNAVFETMEKNFKEAMVKTRRGVS